MAEFERPVARRLAIGLGRESPSVVDWLQRLTRFFIRESIAGIVSADAEMPTAP